jgi:hypothetical protein
MAYKDIDMCGQGDVEIIGDWKQNHTIEDLKRMCEEKNYSAFSVCSAGVPSFGHAALKKFDFKLTKEDCKPTQGYSCLIFIYESPEVVAATPKVDLSGHWYTYLRNGSTEDECIDHYEFVRDGDSDTYNVRRNKHNDDRFKVEGKNGNHEHGPKFVI